MVGNRMEVDLSGLDDMERLDLFDEYFASLSGPGLASGSNASLEHLESLVEDIHGQIVPSSAAGVEGEEVEILEYASPSDALSADLLALSPDFTLDRNVIIYEGIWNGSECRLVLPASVEGSLYVDDSGYLYNVGTSNVVGRIYYDGFEPLDYNTNVFTLQPLLNLSPNNLYEYGYPSYNRRYYESGGRLQSTTTYGLFQVSKVVRTPSADPQLVNGIYLLVLIFLGGVNLLCLWKKSRN